MSKIRKGVMVEDIFYGLEHLEEFVDSIKEGMPLCDLCDFCDLKSECCKDEEGLLSDMCNEDDDLSLPSVFKKVL